VNVKSFNILFKKTRENEMKLSMIIIFIFTFSIYAQTSWLPPQQLSIDGIGPYLFMGVPAITVDSSGTIHAFWVISPLEDGSTYIRYSQIEYRRSVDGGQTWSATENLTPEYTTERIYAVEAVCDSKNNVHLVYLRGSEGSKVMYKKYDGIEWTEPYEVYPYATVNLRLARDSVDRIYAAWVLGQFIYYTYLDQETTIPAWSPSKKLDEKEYGIDGLCVDFNDNLYGIGSSITWEENTGYTYRPYMFEYDRVAESWINIEEIYGYQEKTLGGAIALSEDDSIFVNVAVGYSLDLNTDNHLSKYIQDFLWSEPYAYSENNNWDREMYIDQHNYLHLFEKHYYEGDVGGDAGLIHSTGKNGVWTTVSIDSTHNFSYTEPNVAFDKVLNEFYLIYKKFDIVNSISRIYFQSKQNDTGIEESDNLSAKDYELFQNYPNPFNNQTTINYSIKNNAYVKLSVYNSKGELISNFINQKQNRGRHSFVLNSDKLNSGVYYYRLDVDSKLSTTRKMLYLK